MDLVFMSTFDNQSMSIGCVGKFGHLFGLLRQYLLIQQFHKLSIFKKSEWISLDQVAIFAEEQHSHPAKN